MKIINVGSAQLPSYDPRIALRVCEKVAGGETLSQICKQKGFPTQQTVRNWVVLYEEFAKAFARAKEISASSMEEELLDMARELRATNDFNNNKIKQYQVAMAQLRWSAARRDPKNFGERKPDGAGLSITINTPLDMNVGGLVGEGFDNVFKIEVKIPDNPPPPTDITEAGFEELPPVDYNDEGMEAFELPEKAQQHLTQRNKPIGRPLGKGKHKSPQATKAAITRIANKRKKEIGTAKLSGEPGPEQE